MTVKPTTQNTLFYGDNLLPYLQEGYWWQTKNISIFSSKEWKCGYATGSHGCSAQWSNIAVCRFQKPKLRKAHTNSLADEPVIPVGNLEVAQFIYLLLDKAKVRDVINTITTKVVLILGRFTPERKALLDALKDALGKTTCLSCLILRNQQVETWLKQLAP